jgi:uncharacterized cupredoxin-like copper-binding protein
VSNLQAPGSATQGDAIDVSADVTNEGEQSATKAVEFRVDVDGDGFDGDDVVLSQDVQLDAGDSTTVTFEDVDTSALAPGTYTHGVVTPDDSATAQITINTPAEPDPANFQVSNLQAPGTITQGDLIDASVMIENTGGQTATKTVEFRVDTNGDGSIADESAVRSQDVELAPGESETFSFEDIDTSGLPIGTFTHGVVTPDDSATAQITIEEPAEPAPETSLHLDPSSDTVQEGKTTSYDVVVGSADDGVAAAELSIVVDDPSVATITGATVFGQGEEEIDIAADGSRVDIDYDSRDTMDAGSFPIIQVTVEGQATGETDLSIAAAEGNDEVLLVNEEGIGYDVTDTMGATLTVKSGDGGEPTPEPPEPEVPTHFQIDLVEGEVLQQLDPDEGDTYHKQDRFITALHVNETGDRSGGRTAHEGGTYQSDGCEVTYSRLSFDPDTGVSEVSVSVSDVGGCEEITLSYAGYELPEGTTGWDPDRAEEQELKDSVTVTLEPGDEETFTIDVMDEGDTSASAAAPGEGSLLGTGALGAVIVLFGRPRTDP